MATYGGRQVGTLFSRPLDERTYLSVNVQTGDDVTYDPALYVISSPKAGTPSVFNPASAINTYIGVLPSSVNTPFYKELHFVQDLLIIDGGFVDLGVITNDTSSFFGVFNIKGYTRTVQTVGITSATAGISVANISPGTVFGPYEEIRTQLDLLGTGDAVIDTTFYIKFDDEATIHTIELKGSRFGSFYTSEPNWEDGIQIERRFLTSVFTSGTMAETRKMLRPTPQRAMSASVFFANKDAAGQLWASMRNNSKQSTVHPWYPDKSGMTASSTVLRVYCVTEYRRFKADDYAFLIKSGSPDSYNESEIVRIDEVFADGFSTVADIQGSYVLGDLAYPAFIGYASLEGSPVELMTTDKGVASLTVEEVYGPAVLAPEDATYTPTIRNSLPVMDLEITFSEVPEQSILTGGGLESSGRGYYQYAQGVPYLVQTVTVLARTKAECWNHEGFFNYIQGRGRVFWAVDMLEFMEFVGSAGNTTFTVSNDNPLVDWDYLTYVKVTDSNGDYDMLQVVGRAEVVNDIQITVEANSLADIVSARQVHKVRMAEDLVSEDYLTDSVMLCTFAVQELQGA